MPALGMAASCPHPAAMLHSLLGVSPVAKLLAITGMSLVTAKFGGWVLWQPALHAGGNVACTDIPSTGPVMATRRKIEMPQTNRGIII